MAADRAIGARTARGLTLLEVVMALLLFSMMSLMMLSGLSNAQVAAVRAERQRDMAYLLSFRLGMAAVLPEDYEHGDYGEFPALDKSSRFVDEAEVFGDRYAGYTWEIEKTEMIGAGAGAPVTVEGGDPVMPLFAEEGAAEDGTEEPDEMTAQEVDRLFFIRVTVYPPGWEDTSRTEEAALQPQSAWTAVPVPVEDEEGVQ